MAAATKRIGQNQLSGPTLAAPSSLNVTNRSRRVDQNRSKGSRHLKVKLALLAVLLTCLLWTFWLLILTIYPDATMNYIMGTAEHDAGSFWLMPKPGLPLMLTGSAGLALVAAGYLFNLLELVQKGKAVQIQASTPGKATRQARGKLRAIRSKVSSVRASIKDLVANVPDNDLRRGSSFTKSAAKLAADVLLRKDSSARKNMNVALKLGDLAIQTVQLVQLMERGFPHELVWIFTALVSLNSSAHSVMAWLSRKPTFGLHQVVIDTTFDTLVAIASPMPVVCWSLSSFTFDRKTFAIIQDVFPDGRFERMARLNANPVQIDIITQSLRSLRVLSVLDFFTRMGTNLMLCFRFHNLISMLRAPEFKQYVATYPRQRRLALVFFAIPILLTVFAYKSIATSDLACSSHPECATHAQRWTSIREGDFRAKTSVRASYWWTKIEFRTPMKRGCNRKT